MDTSVTGDRNIMGGPDDPTRFTGQTGAVPPGRPIGATAAGPDARTGGGASLPRRREGWSLALPLHFDTAGREPPLIMAVGGGKGGVGKSLVSANLAVRLASTGRKVVAIDLDIGGANLHTYFGVKSPVRSFADLVVQRSCSLSEALTPTPVSGVRIIAGGREETWGGISSLSLTMMRQAFSTILDLREQNEADIVILDLGAGSARHTVDFFMAAHLGLLTVLPEPTSIENAYLFLKTVLLRLIENTGDRVGMMPQAHEVIQSLVHDRPGATDARRPTGYLDRLRRMAATNPALFGPLGKAITARTIGITVNQTRSQADIDVGKSMEMIGERYFGFRTRYLGYLNYDESAIKSLRNRRLLVQDFPHSTLARRLNDLARMAMTHFGI